MASKVASDVTIRFTADITDISTLPTDRTNTVETILPYGWRMEHVFHPRGMFTPDRSPSFWIYPPREALEGCIYQVNVCHRLLSGDRFHSGAMTILNKRDEDDKEKHGWDSLTTSNPMSGFGSYNSISWADAVPRGFQCELSITCPLTPENPAAALSTPALNLIRQHLDKPVVSDVQFNVLSRRRSSNTGLRVGCPLPVWANSTLITRNCDYLKNMLLGGFSESLMTDSNASDEDAWLEEYDYWSDSDLEDESDGVDSRSSADSSYGTRQCRSRGARGEGKGSAIQSSGPFSGASKVVSVNDAAYITWKAMIYYMCTSQITFAPLTSSKKREYGLNDSLRGEGPLMASPKSVFRLAHKMGMEDLCSKAKRNIEGQLTNENILTELFSSFTSRYVEFREMQLRFAARNWRSVREKPEVRKVLEELSKGESRRALETIVQLLAMLNGSKLPTV